MEHKYKYIKYKTKYLELNDNMLGGGRKKHSKKTSKKLSRNNIETLKFNVSEPWFSLIYIGLKTVEGRKNTGRFKEMKVGDIIEWQNNDFKPRSIKTKIVGKSEYKTFKEYLETEGLEKCLPSIPTIEDGLSVYYKYYTKKDEEMYGVVAIRLERV
jgi:ASC-1-like (ASCH) protein